jgi:hydrogenase maturation factor
MVRPGDVLLVTKGIAVEGTAIIAREKSDELAEVDEPLLARCRDFLYDPGISVVQDAAVATAAGEVHAMHDPTEGGLATGLWELAEAGGLGLEIQEEAIPILPETATLCARLNLDPLGLIASGSLLLAVAPGDAPSIITALEGSGITATQIGHVTEPGGGIVLQSKSGERPLPQFERDEIARLFK